LGTWRCCVTWVRHASFSGYALLGLGYTEVAAAFGLWLRHTMEHDVAAGESLRLLCRVDGSSDLKEEVLDHFEGYRGSAPVRIGNGAADQLQLDIYGELIDSVYLYNRHASPIHHDTWMDLCRLVDWVCDNWHEVDDGNWELRSGRQPFT